jgi:type I restriction enzyme S subunit
MSNKAKNHKGLQPILRFPEFRNAEGWQQSCIGELGSFYYGKSAPKWSLSADAPTLCVRYGELYTKFGTIISEVVSRTNTDPATLRFSKGGEILIPRVGEKPEDFANCCYLPFPDIAIGEMISVYETKEYPIFYTYYFRTLKKQFAKVVEGQNVKNLYYVNLEPIQVGKPPIAEQKKIAECLSSLDELIEVEDQKLDALQQHKKGLMQELFPAEGETLPKRRFPEFENAPEWEEIEVSELFNLQDGYAFSSSDFVDFASDTVQVIRITDINNHNKNESKVYIPKSSIEEMKLTKFWVEEGDLLLSLTGAAGFNFFVWDSEPALINQRTMKITLKNRANAAMKILLSSLIYDKINEHGSGQNNNLSKESLKAVKLLMPKPDEQQRIADFISSIDDLIAAQSQKTNTLRDHKMGLMQQLFPAVSEVQE